MRHVLIIDDALSLGRLLKTALSTLDATMPVVVVSSPEEALLEGTRFPLDLLITDIQLSEILKVDLIRRIRSHHPKLHVIVIGGVLDDEDSDQVQSLEVDAFFSKPLDITELTNSARRFLGLDSVAEHYFSSSQLSLDELSLNAPQVIDTLADFRRKVGASAVLMLDSQGRMLARIGETNEEEYLHWMPELLSAAKAGRDISPVLGQAIPENLMYFQGEQYDLFMTPVFGYSMLVVVDRNASVLRLALAFEETVNAQKTLANMFMALGLSGYAGGPPGRIPPVPIPENVSDSVDGKADRLPDQITALFDEDKVAIDNQQADSYWESIPEESAIEPTEPDTLTYDQAQQLGLTPGDLEE